MALLTLPFPNLDDWAYEIELDDVAYKIQGRVMSPPNIAPYFTIDLLLADETPIEIGMKVTLGTRYAFRNGKGVEGVLFFVAQGQIEGDYPSPDDLKSGKVVMCYDEAV
jgi:hypothetical protein